MNARSPISLVVAAGVAVIFVTLSALIALRSITRVEYDAAGKAATSLAQSPRARAASATTGIAIHGDSVARAHALSLSARERRLMMSEDRVLVLGRGSIRVVTAPIKDRDDWDIVGVAAVLARPYREVAVPLALLGLGAALAMLAALTGIRRIAQKPDLVARVLVGAGAAILALTSAALSQALARIPRASSALLGLVAVSAAGAVCAAAWVASGRRRPALLHETVTAWGFLAPSLIHLIVFTAGPLLFALFISFHRWDLLDPVKPFVGLGNYAELMRDRSFLNALVNTALYSLYVPVTMVLALGAALALNQPLRGIGALRTIVFMPYVASFVALAIVWQWMFNYDFGLLNRLLSGVRLPPIDWLGDPRTALAAVMVVSAWVQLGYQMVIYLAALQGIPETLYEAARLDGADYWQRFRHITVPLLRPATIYILVTGIIWSFQVFTLIYVMTEGGPLHSTEVVVYQIYQNAWEFRRMGYAAAMSWILFGLLFFVTLLQWKTLNRKIEYA